MLSKVKKFKIERCFKVKLDEYKKIISTSQNINKKNHSIKIANINLGNLNYMNNIETLKLKNDTDEYFLKK